MTTLLFTTTEIIAFGVIATMFAVLFGLGITILFWIYTMKKDESVSEHMDEIEYEYEFWLEEEDVRVKNN